MQYFLVVGGLSVANSALLTALTSFALHSDKNPSVCGSLWLASKRNTVQFERQNRRNIVDSCILEVNAYPQKFLRLYLRITHPTMAQERIHRCFTGFLENCSSYSLYF